MLESFKRLFAGRAPDAEDHAYDDVIDWAARRGFGFKRARDAAGFVVDGALDGKPWRIEWGPPQREYIVGHELRLRMELEMPSEAQMLLMSRPLMDALERKTFEEFTDAVQTHIGGKVPEEVRWLVMFPKVDLTPLKGLRSRFGAVASSVDAGFSWVEGPLSKALEHASHGLLKASPPLVLMTLRGRAYLRMELSSPDAPDIAAALALFETAVSQALIVADQTPRRPRDFSHSSATTAWQSLQPSEISDPRKR